MTYLFNNNLPQLERRLQFLEEGCHPEVKESLEYWAITELYKAKIKKLSKPKQPATWEDTHPDR